MENKLPTEDLKRYGIINEDNSFSKKLSADDVTKFLSGAFIVADNDLDRIMFQLSDNNTKLNVRTFRRDKKLQDILENSKNEITFSKINEIEGNKQKRDDDYNVKVFIPQKEQDKLNIKEYDLFHDIKEVTKLVLATQELKQIDKYKTELLKLKAFIQDKIDKFPELGKQLTENINIVSNEINSVNSTSIELNKKQEKSKIDLDVNDPDLYQDANREREEQEEIEQEQKRGRRR